MRQAVCCTNHYLHPLWMEGMGERHSLALNTTGRRRNSVKAFLLLAAELVSKQAGRKESFLVPGWGTSG